MGSSVTVLGRMAIRGPSTGLAGAACPLVAGRVVFRISTFFIWNSVLENRRRRLIFVFRFKVSFEFRVYSF